MEAKHSLEKPESLEAGQRYYLQVSHKNPAELLQVIFLAYTACPAVVIVQDGNRARLRVSRALLYVA